MDDLVERLNNLAYLLGNAIPPDVEAAPALLRAAASTITRLEKVAQAAHEVALLGHRQDGECGTEHERRMTELAEALVWLSSQEGAVVVQKVGEIGNRTERPCEHDGYRRCRKCGAELDPSVWDKPSDAMISQAGMSDQMDELRELVRALSAASVCHACHRKDWNGYCMNGAYHANLGATMADQHKESKP